MAPAERRLYLCARGLLGVRWGDRVIPAVVPADPCASTAAAWGFAERVGLPLEQAQRVADDLDALRGATSSRSPLLGAPDAPRGARSGARSGASRCTCFLSACGQSTLWGCCVGCECGFLCVEFVGEFL